MKEINFKKYEAILYELHDSDYITTKHYEKLVDKSINMQSNLILYWDIVDKYEKYLSNPKNITFLDIVLLVSWSWLLHKCALCYYYKINYTKRILHKKIVRKAIKRYPDMPILLDSMPKEVREDIDFVLYTLATTRIEENV